MSAVAPTRGATGPGVDVVVFDLGGVLIDWDPRYLYRELIADADEAERFLAEVCTPAWNDRCDRGLTLAEATAALAGQRPDHAALIAAYHQRWPEMVRGEFPGTVAVLAELRAAGVRCYALSNMPPEALPVIHERFAFLDWFHGRVYSCEERVAKPDPAMFERCTQRFDLDPGRVLFVDDNPANVAAAHAAGWSAVRFSEPAALRVVLVELGLLPA